LIEIQYYNQKQLIEEVLQQAIMLALKNYEAALALALAALKAAASTCW